MSVKVYPIASTNVKYYIADHMAMNKNLIKEKTIFEPEHWLGIPNGTL